MNYSPFLFLLVFWRIEGNSFVSVVLVLLVISTQLDSYLRKDYQFNSWIGIYILSCLGLSILTINYPLLYFLTAILIGALIGLANLKYRNWRYRLAIPLLLLELICLFHYLDIALFTRAALITLILYLTHSRLSEGASWRESKKYVILILFLSGLLVIDWLLVRSLYR